MKEKKEEGGKEECKGITGQPGTRWDKKSLGQDTFLTPCCMCFYRRSVAFCVSKTVLKYSGHELILLQLVD